MNSKTTDPAAQGHINTPSQMVTPIQPITDDLPKTKPQRTGERFGGLTQEEASEVTETTKIDEVPPAEAMEPKLYRDDEE